LRQQKEEGKRRVSFAETDQVIPNRKTVIQPQNAGDQFALTNKKPKNS
jgi:hypothetical protein